jgi:hypothetical protein
MPRFAGRRIQALGWLASHTLTLLLGVALGVYFLPILTAPQGPTEQQVQAQAGPAAYQGQFRRDLKDSDALHWGEGLLNVSARSIGLVGEISPGPDYKLYLSPQFVETERDFERLKDRMVRVGDVKTFKNFLLQVPESVNIDSFNTVIVWCEAFGQFITAAKYK